MLVCEARPQQLSLLKEHDLIENDSFLKEQIITYIGNKRSLLPFIGKGVALAKNRLDKQKVSCLDLFSGSGVVSRYLKQFSDYLVANDLESYSQVTNKCYLTNYNDSVLSGLKEIIRELNHTIEVNLHDGFISELYAPKDESNIQPHERVFYTKRNAQFLDTARQLIDTYPEEIRHLLIAPLISKASVHANTSGVFKGFYKSKEGIGQFGGSGKDALSRIKGRISVPTPIFSNFHCEFSVSKKDANSFVSEKHQHFDIVYLDPPYNQHPYGSNYFMLNLLVDYTRPDDMSKVSGIPKDWNRSKYNQRAEAAEALFHVIESLNASHIIISYNSEGFISHEQFLTRLQNCGKLSVLETPYNTFRGSRNLSGRALHVTEFLYLLEK